MLCRVVLVALLAANSFGAALAAAGAGGEAAPQSRMSEEELRGMRDAARSRSDEADRRLNEVTGTSPLDILMQPAPPSGHAGGLSGVDPELQRNLALQIEATQRRLEEARQRLGASQQDGTLALSQQLLDIARARLSGDATGGAGAMEDRIAGAMDHAQRQIDLLRASLPGSADGDLQNEKLDRMQQHLDLARQRFSGTDSQPVDAEQIARLYARTQERLDEARERARNLPDSAKLLQQLDAAQQRLDEARADLGGQSGFGD